MGGKIGVYPMSMYNSFEIDNMEDIDLIKT